MLVRCIMIGGAAVLLAGCAKNPGEICFDKIKPMLKDPTTATLITYRELGEKLGVAVEVRASNSYGAFEHTFARCGDDGQVKWFETRQDALL